MGESAPPREIAGIYCYADFQGEAVYEKQCRQFDSAGFVRETADDVGSAPRSVEIFVWALVFTVDARGALMVFASLLASVGIAILIRRQVFGPP